MSYGGVSTVPPETIQTTFTCDKNNKTTIITFHYYFSLVDPRSRSIKHFESLDSLRRRANARKVSFRISLRWPIHIINPADKTKLSCYTPHRRSTTATLETCPLYYNYYLIILLVLKRTVKRNHDPVLFWGQFQKKNTHSRFKILIWGWTQDLRGIEPHF